MSTTNEPQGPIFVVGCQRSGTSALWRAIGSHPRLLIPDSGPIGPDGKPIRKELWFVREYLLGREKNRSNALAGTEVDREFRRRFARLVDDFYREHFASPSGRWLSAHPADGTHVREILEMFPDASVLFLTRHPQEVVWSSLHAPWMEPVGRPEFMERAANTARWWRRFGELCVEALDGGLGPRVLVVRHERMIREPEAVAREYLEFVGETYHEDAAASLGKVFNSSFLKNDEASDRVERARSGVGADHEVCRRVVQITGDLMERLGYQDLSGQITDLKATHREYEATRTDRLRRMLNTLHRHFEEHPGQARWVYKLLGLSRQNRKQRAALKERAAHGEREQGA